MRRGIHDTPRRCPGVIIRREQDRTAMDAPSPRPRRRRAFARAAAVGEASAERLNVEALSERTGVSVRNIRAYQTAGLLPPPSLQGRVAFYGAEHLGKLELVRDLRRQGFSLETIKQMLNDTPDGAWSEYALISGLFSTTLFTVEQPQRKRISDMAAHWAVSATAAQKERLTENGLYRRVGPDEVEMLSPSLERIGIQLAELGVPLNTVLELQDQLISHSRAVAQVYVRELFMAMAQQIAQQPDASASDDPRPQAARLAEAIRTLFERLRPLAIGSVSAVFPVILQQEFDRAVQSNRTEP